MIPLSLAKVEKSIFMYLNYTLRPERTDCTDYFRAKRVAFHPSKHFPGYLEDLSESIFVVSPKGHGLDTHRTWEALLMGCIPIVPSSTLNPLYEDLPVIVINSWDEVTTEFLTACLDKLKSKTWCRNKLYAHYWFNKIQSIQERIRQSSQ
jgi:hypothetical protein